MTLDEKKALVATFLKKCNEYAERQIAALGAELEGASPRRALEIQDKIGHWTAYRAFNVHAIEELRTSKLDDWFA
ncbi:MAG TPA: hypothetical protein VIN61_06920 [Gammaproteobacteria bacterium]